MAKVYITFGQIHTHSVGGKTFDKDCVAEIECTDHEDGRDKAFELFGDKWCFAYFQKVPYMSYFPRGVIACN